MSLSIDKLQEFLANQSLIPIRYYIMDGLCFFIELFHIKTSDIFLLYIPSQYNFPMKAGGNIFNMKYLDITKKDNKAEDYGSTAEDNEPIVLLSSDDDLEESLKKNYKKEISLELNKEDSNVLRSIIRQMERLKTSVQNIKYKLGVFYKNYACVIRRDDSIDCLFIQNYPRENTKKLVVITDLEVLYAENEKVIDNINTVRKSIYEILQKNQGTHFRVLDKIAENKKEMLTIPQQADLKKEKYDSILEKYERILAKISIGENNILSQLKKIAEDRYPGIHGDIQKAQARNKFEKDLDNLLQIKKEISKNMIAIREKKENTLLNIDKIMFDNTVMFDAMIKNFAKLKEFC